MSDADDSPAELDAMAAGLSGRLRHFCTPEEAVAAYASKAAYEAEWAAHKFYVSTVHPETQGQVRYADLLRAVIVEMSIVDPDARAEVYRLN